MYLKSRHSLPERVQKVKCRAVIIDFVQVISIDSSAFSISAYLEQLAVAILWCLRPVYSGWHDVSFLGGSVLAYACESVSLAPARTFLSVRCCRSTSIMCSLLQYAEVTDY